MHDTRHGLVRTGFSGGGLLVLVPLGPGEEWHGTTRLPAGVSTQVVDLVEARRSVADVARDLGVSDQSIYIWGRQDRIDRGLVPGLTSGEKAELSTAKRRIAELETEPRAMGRAVGLGRPERRTERSR